jgi:signal transduction histidine kinase
MNKLNEIIASVLGDKGEVEQERYFMTMTCFVTSVFLMFLCLFHIIMNLKMLPVFLAGASSLVLLGLYFLVRFYKCLLIPKIIVTLFGLVLLDLTWYSKFLSHGPVLYFIFAFGALLIWVWEGKSMIVMLVIYFLNIAVLYIIENSAQSSLLIYPNARVRETDIYLSFFFYSLLMIFILSRIKIDFVWQKEKAIKSDKLKTAFLANMSHEIRTPVNSILGFSKLLDKETNPMKRHEYVSIIQSCSSNLMNLINDLLDLSKIEAGELNLCFSDFSIKELFDEMKDTYTIELQKKDATLVQLNYYLPDPGLIIHSDLFRVKQVLANLLRNAIKFTSRGIITFSCAKIEDEVIFSVTDTGTGIPKEDQQAIFHRFTKFDYDGLNTEGTGIGLSIVEKIVAMLKGKIWLTSNLGEGSSFFFSLPFVQGSPHREKMEYRRVSNEVPVSESGKLILIVEDDLESSILLKELLSFTDHIIHQVDDGKKAIDFIREHPDTRLILMDIKLPVMDGYEATSVIKKLYPAIPIIAQTAYAMAGDKEKAITAGCDAYFTKPIDPVKFMSLIRVYI